MKKIYLSFLIVLLPIFVIGQNGQEKLSLSTRSFLSTLKDNKQPEVKTLKKSFAVKSVNEQLYIDAIVELTPNANVSEIEALGAKLTQITPTIFTATIPVKVVEAVATLSFVKRIEIATPVNKKMDKARVSANVDKVHAATDLTMPYKGKDVVVGVIDMGFEYTHINFYDATKTNLRVKRVWNQNDTIGANPSGYNYGAEYTTESAMKAAKYDSDTETHATHVAGIAAGADATNGFQGIAGEADLVFVSMNESDQTANNKSLLEGIKYIYDYATSVGKPAVVNMSLGTHQGSHDGTSLFDQACDAMQGAGKLLVGSAGNEGGDKIHISRQFTSSMTTLKSFFSFLDSKNKYAAADIWGEVGKNFKVKVGVYDSRGVKVYETADINTSIGGEIEMGLATSPHGASGSLYIGAETNSNNIKPHALIVIKLASIRTGYNIGLIITAQDGAVHAWTPTNTEFASNTILGWSNGDSQSTVGEIGGTGKNIISVGAYLTKKTYTTINNESVGYTNYLTTVDEITPFSSLGPTMDGRIKPDISAPGAIIISSYSSASGVLSADAGQDFSSLAKKNLVNGKYYYYGEMIGTSMSSPFVTGVLATWLQAKPNLTPDEVRKVLDKTSIKDLYTGSTTNNIWGRGKIDAWAGIKECIAISGIDENMQDKASSAIVYPNPNNGDFKLLFLTTDNNVSVSVFDVNGKKVYNTNIGAVVASQEAEVNLKGVAKGVYLVSVKGASSAGNYRLIIQ